MDDTGEFLYCKECGNKMKKTQRCCLKCGSINYLNEENDGMEESQKKADKQKKERKKSFRFVSSEDAPNRVLLAKNAGNRLVCLFFNIFFYILPIFAIFVHQEIPIDKNLFLNYRYSVVFFAYTYIWFLLLGLQLLFMKTDNRWWSVFIPFYGLYNWFKITMKNGWLFLTILIPPVGIVFLFISLWKLGERFDRSKILCLLFPYIMIPRIAYNDDCLYEEVTYSFTEETDEKALMHNYKVNHNLSRFMGFVTVVCLIINGYYWGREYLKYRYVDNVNAIINKISVSKITCGNIDVNSINEYYIRFNSAEDELRIELPSKYDAFHKTYSGYIKIVKGDRITKYYVSMTNGYYGIRDKELDKVVKEDLEYGTKLVYNVPDGKIKCNVIH